MAEERVTGQCGTPLIRSMGPRDVPEAVRFHADWIGHSVFTRLGGDFLAVVYREMSGSPSCACLVAEDETGMKGFIAGTEDTGALFRAILRKRPVLLAKILLRTLFASPGLLISLMETPRYFGRTPAGRGAAELLFIAVRPECRGKGTATALLSAAVAALAPGKGRAIKVSITDDNSDAASLLERCGFSPAREFRFYGEKRRLYVRLPEAMR